MSAHWDAFRFSEKKTHTLEYIYFECTYWYGFNETSSFLFLPLDVEMLNLESLKRCTCTTLFPFCSAPLRRHLFHFFSVLLGTGVWWNRGGCRWCVALVVLVQLFTAEITLIVDTAARRSSYAVHVLIKKPRRHVVLVFPPPSLVCTWSGYNQG